MRLWTECVRERCDSFVASTLPLAYERAMIAKELQLLARASRCDDGVTATAALLQLERIMDSITQRVLMHAQRVHVPPP